MRNIVLCLVGLVGCSTVEDSAEVTGQNPETLARTSHRPPLWWIIRHDRDGDGYTILDGDCDDRDPAVYPGAEEIENGIDDDCNGSVDDVCAFEVETLTGTAELGNDFTVNLGQRSPSGVADPGVIEVLRLEMTASDAGCSSIIVSDLEILGAYTDNAGTGWAPASVSAVDLRTGEDLGNATLVTGGIAMATFSGLSLEIEAGATHGIGIYADVTGADEDLDDQVWFGLLSDSLVVSDGTVTVDLANEDVPGFTLVF